MHACLWRGDLIVYPCSCVRRRRQQLQISSPLEELGQSKSNFMWSLFRRGSNSLYKWSTIAATPISGKKTFKNILLQNQKSYDLETWHVESEIQALQRYINDDPGLTLTCLSLGQICLLMHC